MVGLAHVVLHLALCNAAARTGPDTAIAMRVRLINRIQKPQFDQTFSVQRGYESQRIVEFDAPRGVFHMIVNVPKYNCNASDYLMFLSDHNRSIDETLSDGPALDPHPLLMEGTAPAAFLYVSPTFTLFDKSQQCNTPVGDPLPARIVVENEQDGFYTWLYPDPSLVAHAPVVVALKLATATGENHYIRLKVPFPTPWLGWPQTVQFNVTEDVIDGIASQPTETLLCPRIYETSVG